MIFLLLCISMVSSNPASFGDDSTDTLPQGKQLRDGDSLFSPNRAFQLKFRRIDPTSKNKYLVIHDNRYNRGDAWVANRNNPITDETGRLEIDPQDGMLKILHSGGTLPLPNSSELIPFDSTNPRAATLLDDGNFVLRRLNSDGSVNSTLWQSFDYPTDTLLPGMKLGVDLRTGRSHNWSLSSWKGESVPAMGEFTLTLDPKGSKQLILLRRGIVYWTSGKLRNGRFGDLSLSVCYNFIYNSSEDEKYFTYSLQCGDIDKAGLTLDYDGGIVEGTEIARNNYCVEKKGKGCITKESSCNTRPHGFWSPKSIAYAINGESYRFAESSNLGLVECRAICLANCSCVAYGSITADGIGCEIWSEFNETNLKGARTRLLYIFHQGTAPRKKWWIWLVSSIVGTALLSSGMLFCFIRRKKLKIKDTGKMLNEVVVDTTTSSTSLATGIDEKTVCLFSFESMVEATDNFCDANKLGEGGFGSVYKGNLSCGQEVAIKRLSRNSGQGLVQFKNEILLIAKLQHTNLVKILGSCIQGQEMMLVYEYMQNKSLDCFLFDSSMRPLLKWKIRVNIIEGIAQGLLYLHKYSRLKVIHRDLKASNVLLDGNMNPKISDFGMAKIFEVQDLEANTKRIVGTHGYMPPEYIINGNVSLKTDVFSFGVLLLEIISGKRNRDSYDINRPLNLVGLAWELWVDGRAMELIDPAMDEQLGHGNEVMKYINMGLLCVQDSPAERPSMMDVVSMLTTEFMDLPTPKQPGFFIPRGTRQTYDKATMNELSLSLIEGR